MDFNNKNSETLKTKKCFKQPVTVMGNLSKIKSSDWVFLEQNLKKLKLNSNKILNVSSSKLFKKSTFTLFNPIINSMTVLLTPKYKTSIINLNLIKNQLEPLFLLLAVKINNKIYSIKQIETLKAFNYKKTVYKCYFTIYKSTKTNTLKLLSK